MKLDRAIALLKKHGTNFRKYPGGGSTHYAADINGWTVSFWQHVTKPDEASACVIAETNGTGCEMFSGKGISTTIKRCLEGYYKEC